MEGVASFKQATSLDTHKKINLVYGLNGTGKSTISNFLYAPSDPEFLRCQKTLDQTAKILVYNQAFIRDNFFVSDNLKGIFSLSKENKVAEQKIAERTKKKIELEQSLQSMRDTKEGVTKEFDTQKQKAVDEVWGIKKTYTGGDRVLEYCLEGLKGQKDKLFSHLQGISKPANAPARNVQALKEDVEALKGDDAQPKQRLETLSFQAHQVESDQLLSTSILGNADSEVADLIEQLGNGDWVNQGLVYLPGDAADVTAQCPFCQEETITAKFVENVKSYFNASYQNQIDALEQLLQKYRTAITALPNIGEFTEHPFAKERENVLSSKYQLLVVALHKNASEIEEKLKSPKSTISLSDTIDMVKGFNEEIVAINAAIDEYNKKLQNREDALEKLSEEFWRLMRWQYDQTISRFEQDRQDANKKNNKLDTEITNISTNIATVEKQIREAQEQTVNVDAAVDAINAGLLELGIDGFSVQKYSESLYRVVRPGDSKDAFRSLSEGEKMMISFLYFCELCNGKSSVDDTHAQRIVVIDDPISSLSHVFIFNVGQLIRSVFFRGTLFPQVFVLTHSLYFFHELTDPNHQRREKTQKLFRITKPSSGSLIKEMEYEEIQNDYQAYWSVVNDPNQPPALVANCMRNIVEYFFNFVRKKDLNNVFQMPDLQNNKYQAFCRYINRESHSLGQNIVDMKEFDYGAFREGLRLVFEEAGYPEHFAAMSKC